MTEPSIPAGQDPVVPASIGPGLPEAKDAQVTATAIKVHESFIQAVAALLHEGRHRLPTGGARLDPTGSHDAPGYDFGTPPELEEPQDPL